ncbi:MAG: hypothetical protein SGARI_008051 [Bacillariaceae sp.]
MASFDGIGSRDAAPGGASRSGSNLRGGGTTGDLVSNDGCAVQCITSGKAYARGVDALLQVRTATPATIVIQVFDNAGLLGLKPGTTYTAVATATDSNGNTAVGHGSFTTLVRNVEISFPWQASMLFNLVESDGNDPTYAKRIWHDGSWIEEQYENLGVASDPLIPGQPYTLGMFQETMAIDNAEKYLELTLQMQMDNRDCDPCEVIGPPEQPFYGAWEGSGIYWAFSELAGGFPFDLDINPGNAESSHTLHVFPPVPMSPPPLVSDPVYQLEVHAKIVVSYDPI